MFFEYLTKKRGGSFLLSTGLKSLNFLYALKIELIIETKAEARIAFNQNYQRILHLKSMI